MYSWIHLHGNPFHVNSKDKYWFIGNIVTFSMWFHVILKISNTKQNICNIIYFKINYLAFRVHLQEYIFKGTEECCSSEYIHSERQHHRKINTVKGFPCQTLHCEKVKFHICLKFPNHLQRIDVGCLVFNPILQGFDALHVMSLKSVFARRHTLFQIILWKIFFFNWLKYTYSYLWKYL